MAAWVTSGLLSSTTAKRKAIHNSITILRTTTAAKVAARRCSSSSSSSLLLQVYQKQSQLSTTLRSATVATLLRNQASPRSGAFGSALGTDSSMIATNNRCVSSLAATAVTTTTTTASTSSRRHHEADPTNSSSSSTPQRLPYTLNRSSSSGSLNNIHRNFKQQKDSSMIAANDRLEKQKRALSTAAAVVEEPEVATDAPATPASSNAPSTSGAMQDEYGEMNDDGHTYIHETPFQLESGQVLEEAQLRYQTYGELNEDKDNVLVVCHALTGNASLHAWWGDLLGPGKAFDTDRYFVVCCNILGSCYGSSNPTSINPSTGKPYLKDFPDISVKDTVRLQLEMLTKQLKVRSIKAVIGGSFGGMQAVEFAVQAGSSPSSPYSQDCYFSDRGNDSMVPFVRSVVPIACGAAHTAWQIAISETQRQAIYADPKWESTNGLDATKGLAIARQIGMVSYRTPQGYCAKFGRDMQHPEAPEKYGTKAHWKVKSYLAYQGEKFLSRFDPITYVKMTEQMDSHDVARGRGESIAEVLSNVEIPALVMGIDSDVLYPLTEQQHLASHLPNGHLKIIKSADGHDGFLLEQEQVANHIVDFLEQHI